MGGCTSYKVQLWGDGVPVDAGQESRASPFDSCPTYMWLQIHCNDIIIKASVSKVIVMKWRRRLMWIVDCGTWEMPGYQIDRPGNDPF